jgi:hypothetical protein
VGTESVGEGPDNGIGIRKFDSQGNVLWAQIYDNNSSSYWGDSGTGIDIDSSGNVYVTGHICTGSSWDGSDIDIWIAKLDRQVNLLWTRTHNGSGNRVDSVNDIVVEVEGNLFVVGQESIEVLSNIWIQKMDSDGDELWTETYTCDSCGPTYPWQAFGSGIAFNNDNSAFYVVGSNVINRVRPVTWLRKYTNVPSD